MADWFSSDWHLMHKRIQEFCPYSRKGSDPKEMSDMIISNMCDNLKPGDNLYNIGDVSFGTEEETINYLMKIKKAGIKHHLILGNHDHRVTKSRAIQSCFDSIQDYLEIIFGKKSYIVMSHFPMETWARGHHGAFMLHGHKHSTWQPLDGLRRMDVGLDSRAAGDMKPYHLDEIVSILKPLPFGTHH